MATHYFASHNGGIEIVAEQLYREFAAAGHDVIWIAGDSTPPPQPIGKSYSVPIRVLNFVEDNIGLPFPIPSMGALRTIRTEAGEADLVLLHDCLYLTNLAVFRAARRRSVPTIIVQHIGHIPYRNVALNFIMKIANAIITGPMLRCASQVIFISATTREFFANLAFQRPPELLFNGVDTEVYRPLLPNESRAELRKLYNLPADRPVILFAGRFVEKKGLPILRRMVMMRPTYTWAFAGWGPLDPSTWNAPNVHVFSALRGKSMAALYRSCDLLVLPSVGEGFPLVVQEALASGVPVVCGAETTLADPQLATFVIGVPVNAGKPEQTAATFVEMIDDVLDSDSTTARATEGREFALRRYSWHRAAQHYLEIATCLVSSDIAERLGTPTNERAQQ